MTRKLVDRSAQPAPAAVSSKYGDCREHALTFEGRRAAQPYTSVISVLTPGHRTLVRIIRAGDERDAVLAALDTTGRRVKRHDAQTRKRMCTTDIEAGDMRDWEFGIPSR